MHIFPMMMVIPFFQVYGYARRFAKIGVDRALLNCLKEGLTSQVVSAGIALKTVAVNVSLSFHADTMISLISVTVIC